MLSAESPSENEKYFFWNGRCLALSAVKIWERTFVRAGVRAGEDSGRDAPSFPATRSRSNFYLRACRSDVGVYTRIAHAEKGRLRKETRGLEPLLLRRLLRGSFLN